MARVTVEDCITNIPNRFELVMLASQRARNISAGAELTVELDNDKHPVVALREIAESTVTPETLRDALIRGLQRHAEIDEPAEDEAMELPSVATELLGELAASEFPGMQVVEAGGAGATGGADEEAAALPVDPGQLFGRGDD